MKKIIQLIRNGLFDENPVLVQVLGMCPTLAVTSSGMNGLGMGLATTSVLIGSNFAISILRKIIPGKVRIPAFIVIIATFVTIVDLILQGYFPSLYDALGIFIPLIVVNCVVLGRAEAFASKNKPLYSVIDGIGMGLGFTLALSILGAIREILGNGSVFGLQILSLNWYQPMTIFLLPPGAFLVLGFIFAGYNKLKANKEKE